MVIFSALPFLQIADIIEMLNMQGFIRRKRWRHIQVLPRSMIHSWIMCHMRNGQIIWKGSRKEIEGDLEDFYMEQFDDVEDTVDSFTVSENSGDLGDFRKRGSK